GNALATGFKAKSTAMADFKRKTLVEDLKGGSSVPESSVSFARFLEQSSILSAWLRSGKERPAEMFLMMVEDLSPLERQSLGKLTDRTVEIPDLLLKRLAEMEKENRHLKSLLLTDDLTGLYNRRFFYMQLEIEVSRARRTGRPCCLMMIDCDHFKRINDRCGHDEGDRYLKKVARTIRRDLRTTDFVCRYGGDEFGVIMPDTHLVEGVLIAERLLEAVSEIRAGRHFSSTASIGIAIFDPVSDDSMESFFKRADQELYRAKELGRNRISHSGKPVRSQSKLTEVTPEEKRALYRPERGKSAKAAPVRKGGMRAPRRKQIERKPT
ncbi:MAG TPA: GGDEF domain-containing protein, partial [Syntrophales bacterium]|nr:GGDEF domain-containing protein [Syntrophales bacterium]